MNPSEELLHQIEAYDFELPEELIAQHPRNRRPDARLMLVHRRIGSVSHHRVTDLPALLEPHDLVVLNNTRVFPARLHAQGGVKPIEVLLLRSEDPDSREWKVLARPGRRLEPGRRLVFVPRILEAEVLAGKAGPVRRIRFDTRGEFWELIERHGEIPLPPYIRRPAQPEDRQRYQTIFSEVRGSIAAPTAGLHFDEHLLRQLRHCFLTLHVGYGTFKPVAVSDIREHSVDPELFQIPAETLDQLDRQKQEGNKVVAVGTTTTRVLEHLARQDPRSREEIGETRLYIYPEFEFRLVDKLMTNFHLPKSSLLLLVSAFAGRELILEAYREAIAEGYRFYSYGDSMLIV